MSFGQLYDFEMMCAGHVHVASMGEIKGVYRRNIPLGRHRPRGEDNIKDGSSGSGMWDYGLDRSG